MNPSSAWQLIKLSQICNIEIGKTPSRKIPEYWVDGTETWLSISDMKQGRYLTESKEQITQYAVNSTGIKLIPRNTLLLSYKLSIGKVGITIKPLYTNEAIAALSDLSRDVHIDYLYWALRTIDLEESVDRAAKGKTLNKAKLKEIKIPLPPLQEQKRIAAILDQADALREKRRAAIAKLDELLQSVFLNMFGDPVANTGWERMTVESLASSRKGAIRTGPFGSQLLHSEFVDSGIAVLGIDNAVKNTFTWDQRRYITEDKYQQLKRYKVFPGDILITIMGTCGRCSIVPDDIPEAINTKHLCCISLNQDLCIPEYLHSSFLMHREVLHQLGVSKKGAVMPGLNMQIIKNLKIPVAPLALQERYKAIVQEISSRKASLINHEMKLNTLFSSLKQRAFRGEL